MATEKKVILEVDTAQSQQKIDDLTKKLEGLYSIQNQLKQTIKDLNTEFKNAAKGSAEEAQANAKLSAAQAELVVTTKNISTTKKDLNLTEKESKKLTDDTTSAYKILSQQYQEAAKKAKDLSAEFGVNSNESKTATKEAANLSKQLKDIDQSVGQSTRNVGNYGSALDMLPGSFGSVIESVISTGKALWALVANPIGAVIAAIALALGGLYSVFKNFEPAVWAVQKAMAAVGAVISVLKESVLGFLTGQKSLSESTKGLGDAMSKAAKQAAELKQAQLELGEANELAEITEKRMEAQINKLIIQSKNRALTEQQRIDMINQADKLEDSLHKQKSKRADEDVRIQEESLGVKMKLTDKEIARLKKEGYAYLQRLKETKSLSEEDMKAYKDALLKRIEVDEESTRILERNNNRRDQLEKKQEDNQKRKEEKQKKAQEQEQKREEQVIKSMQNSYNLRVKLQKDYDPVLLANDQSYYDARLKMINDNFLKELEITKTQLKFKKITLEESKLQDADSEIKRLQQIKDLAQARANQLISDLQNELAIEQAHQNQLLAGQVLTLDKQHQINQSNIKRTTTEKIQELDERLKTDAKFQSEYDKQKKLLTEQEKAQLKKDEAEYQKTKLEIQKSNHVEELNNKLELVKGDFDAEAELKKELLTQQMNDELNNVELTESQKAIIREKYAKQTKEIDRLSTESKIQMASDLVKQLGTLFNQGTTASKVAGTASVAIDTYISSAKLFATAMEYFTGSKTILPNPVLGAATLASMGLTIASGVSTISKIWAVDGKAGASGVSPAVSNIAPPQITATSTVTNSTDKKNMPTQKVYVLESDISSTQNKVKVIQNKSTF